MLSFTRSIYSRTLLRCFSNQSKRVLPQDGKTIADFLKTSSKSKIDQTTLQNGIQANKPLNYYIETYGCQMNIEDSDIVRSILNSSGYHEVESQKDANLILLNTCSVRENAESKIFSKIKEFRSVSKKNHSSLKIGVLGCMAEHYQDELLQQGANLVVGPDSYKQLPYLIESLDTTSNCISLDSSSNETYSDIISTHKDGPPNGYITIMRGCNNMCSYCIVPYTRGRERSKSIDTILHEVEYLSKKGYKQITLLGQNVNSYCDHSSISMSNQQYETSPGFINPGIKTKHQGLLFSDLLEQVAQVDPEMRIRFTSPHPKDFPISVLYTIAKYPNICKQIHIPAQSGSTTCLQRMNRGYSRESYMELIHQIRDIIPNVSLSTDLISGFCDETEEEHQDTLSLLREVQYDQAFMFAYSMRDGTAAYHKYKDSVPNAVKQRRLREVIDTFYQVGNEKVKREKNAIQLVLVESHSKQSKPDSIQYLGKNDGGRNCVLNSEPIPSSYDDYVRKVNDQSHSCPQIGEYVAVRVLQPGTSTNIVQPLFKTTLQSFSALTPEQLLKL